MAGELEAAHRDGPITGHLDRDAERVSAARACDSAVRGGIGAGGAIGRRPGTAERRAGGRAIAPARLLDGDRPAARGLSVPGDTAPVRRVPAIGGARARSRACRGRCPFCGGAPWISARREGSLTGGRPADARLLAVRLGMAVRTNPCALVLRGGSEQAPVFSATRKRARRSDRELRHVSSLHQVDRSLRGRAPDSRGRRSRDDRDGPLGRRAGVHADRTWTGWPVTPHPICCNSKPSTSGSGRSAAYAAARRSGAHPRNTPSPR